MPKNGVKPHRKMISNDLFKRKVRIISLKSEESFKIRKFGRFIWSRIGIGADGI